MLYKAGRKYSRKIKDATLIEELAILNGEEPTIGAIIGSAVLCGDNNVEWYPYEDTYEDECNPLSEDSMQLAEQIHNIENADFKTVQQWIAEDKKSWKIGNHVTLKKSNDCMMWYLWFPVWYKANRSYFKAVPKLHLNKREIKKILDAQSWAYI